MAIITGGGSSTGGGLIPTAQISATPPANPTSGMIWIYPADATNGVNWTFVYNAAETTYKWRFSGGPPLQASSNPSLAITSMTQVGATGFYYSGNSITVQRAGDYLIGGTSMLWTNGAAISGGEAQQFAGTGLVGRNAQQPTSVTGFTTIACGNVIVTGISASTVVGICTKTDANPGTQQCIMLVTNLLPVRVI